MTTGNPRAVNDADVADQARDCRPVFLPNPRPGSTARPLALAMPPATAASTRSARNPWTSPKQVIVVGVLVCMTSGASPAMHEHGGSPPWRRRRQAWRGSSVKALMSLTMSGACFESTDAPLLPESYRPKSACHVRCRKPSITGTNAGSILPATPASTRSPYIGGREDWPPMSMHVGPFGNHRHAPV